jgi:hypothetical protein
VTQRNVAAKASETPFLPEGENDSSSLSKLPPENPAAGGLILVGTSSVKKARE